MLDSIKQKLKQINLIEATQHKKACLLYTSDAADEEDSVDLGGRRIIKKLIGTVKISSISKLPLNS